MNDTAKDLINYYYKFTFGNGVETEFNINLDKRTLALIPNESKSHPEWTKLKCFKCPNCPLDEDKNKFCPIAKNLANLIDSFKSSLSYEEVDVLIRTETREFRKHTSLQHGLSSLIGIYMVTSGCPILSRLKPMVRTHLPFATAEETTYRVISMYLLAQYFLYKKNKKPDWDLKQLAKIYDDIQIVNKSFCERLTHINVEDASLNAVVILNTFADHVSFSINKNILDRIEPLFDAYLSEE